MRRLDLFQICMLAPAQSVLFGFVFFTLFKDGVFWVGIFYQHKTPKKKK